MTVEIAWTIIYTLIAVIALCGVIGAYKFFAVINICGEQLAKENRSDLP